MLRVHTSTPFRCIVNGIRETLEAAVTVIAVPSSGGMEQAPFPRYTFYSWFATGSPMAILIHDGWPPTKMRRTGSHDKLHVLEGTLVGLYDILSCF